MSWRTLLISQGGKLSLKQNQLLIQQTEHSFTVPIEDIAVIVIESREVVITTPLLSALALNGVTLLTCDEQFLPCGQWLPFQQYSRQLKTLKLQLTMSMPLKKQLWQTIVQQKIHNQATMLNEIGQSAVAKKLFSMVNQVKSGDRDNHEAQAALLYFQAAFGKGFIRTAENQINAHLNYAYSVLRSAIARALVLYGWLPTLGIFHKSELNPYNLADDFIEPFRPLADLFVWQLAQQDKFTSSLNPESKQKLVGILGYQLQQNQQILSVLASIDRCVGSLQSALLAQNAKLLKLPEIVPLEKHQYE